MIIIFYFNFLIPFRLRYRILSTEGRTQEPIFSNRRLICDEDRRLVSCVKRILLREYVKGFQLPGIMLTASPSFLLVGLRPPVIQTATPLLTEGHLSSPCDQPKVGEDRIVVVASGEDFFFFGLRPNIYYNNIII